MGKAAMSLDFNMPIAEMLEKIKTDPLLTAKVKSNPK
jgi:hypothetical protein